MSDRMGNGKGFKALLSALNPKRPVIVQVHDFPDHDAVGAGYALKNFLDSRHFETALCYSGRLQSASLQEAISMLAIPLTDSADISIGLNHQIVLVDGFIGNKNVTELAGEVIGVIDHHTPPEKPDCKYADVRPGYGSCSTIIWEYYRNERLEMGRDTATALLMGLIMDTAFMTRGVTKMDMNAFSELFFLGDWEASSRTLRNSLSLRDLSVFREAINFCEVAGDFAYVPIQKECSPEVMALTADFFLGLREIHFVVVIVPDRDEFRISVRSEDPQRPSDLVIRKALRGIGYGGGHVHMGGGTIPRDLFPGEQGVKKRFLAALGVEV